MAHKQITIEDILKQPKAREAMNRLGLSPADQTVVSDHLVSYPQLSDMREPIHPNIDNRTLVKIPKRLHEAADEISRINASVFLNPSNVLTGEGQFNSPELEPLHTWRAEGSHLEKAAVFQQLPRILREYSDYLQLVLRILRRRDFPLPSRQQLLRIRLLEIVRCATGKPNYAPIADLLTAALHATGQQKTVEPDQLKLEYHRNPQLVMLAMQADAGVENERAPVPAKRSTSELQRRLRKIPAAPLSRI
jgi:hypothetical protein